MPTTADLVAQKQAAIAVLDNKIADAGGQRSTAVSGADQAKWIGVISKLNAERDELGAAIINAEMDDPALSAALDKLKTATDNMTTVAGEMTDLTSYLNHISDFLDAADSAIGALNG
jgi:hypothetical protein